MMMGSPLRVRLWLGLALSALTAILLTAAFPPYHLGMLIWVGFVPMLVAQYHVLPAKYSSLASAIALAGWLGVLLVPMFGGRSLWMAGIPVAAFFLAFLLDRKKRPFHERTRYRWFVIEGAAGWVGLEMMRSLIPALGTWAFVGYALWEQAWLIQPLAIAGIYGLDLLILLCNYTVAQVVLVILKRHVPSGAVPTVGVLSARFWSVTTSVLVLGWTALSLILYSNAPRDGPVVRVAAVQPNLPRAAHRDTAITSAQRLATLGTLARSAAAQGAQLLVFPEMALGFDPQVQFSDELRALASEIQAYIVIGYVVDDTHGFRNEATVLAPSGEFLGVYGKTHPFVASGEPSTQSAGEYPVYNTPLGKFATLICFDASFTDVARAFSRQGAQLMAAPSLFGASIAQHTYTQIVFRAVENDSPMILADVAYNSAIIDARGIVQQLAVTLEGAQAILIADVPLGRGNTLYSHFGDWLGYVSLAGMCFFAAWVPFSMRRGA